MTTRKTKRTAQQIFNLVKEKLLAQGEQCSNLGSCVYHNDKKGICCAVGHLIPKSQYSDSIEEKGVRHILDNFLHLHVYLLAEDRTLDDSVSLLKDLQQIHDGCEPHNWPKEFEKLATQHCLTL